MKFLRRKFVVYRLILIAYLRGSNHLPINPKVSIVMPVFNGARFIEAAIESIANQTFSDYELIVVDDRSNDETWSVITALMERYDFIKGIRLRRNMGAAFCRNLGIRKSAGEFVAFLDSDDVWAKNKLDVQIDLMEADEIDFCYSNYFIFDESKKEREIALYKSKCVSLPWLFWYCPIGCLTVVYRRSSFPILYMPNIRRGQDYGFWLKLFHCNPKVSYIPHPLASLRRGRGSLSSSKLKKIADCAVMYENEFGKNKLMIAAFVCSHALYGITYRRFHRCMGALFSRRKSPETR